MNTNEELKARIADEALPAVKLPGRKGVRHERTSD